MFVRKIRRRNKKRRRRVAEALYEICAMRKIVLLQSSLSDVANLLRCVLHGTAMQKRIELEHATIGIDFGIERMHHSMR